MPPMQNLLPQLDQPIFTVWLDRHVTPAENKLGGEYGRFRQITIERDTDYGMIGQV